MYLRRMVLEKHSVNEVTGSLTRHSQDLFARSVARSEGVSDQPEKKKVLDQLELVGEGARK